VTPFCFQKKPVSNDHLKSLVVLVVLKDINSSVMTTYSVLPVLHIWLQKLPFILFCKQMLHPWYKIYYTVFTTHMVMP